MKLGIALPNFGIHASNKNITGIASAAEELGFDSLWVSDHIVIPDTHKVFGDTFLEPLTTLAYIAALTKKIMLGTSVLVIPYRNPVVLAKTVSTLDVLSEGRLIFGIGSGWLKEEFSALGAAYSKRDEITDEHLMVMKELFTSEHPEFRGKYYSFSNILFEPRPFQKPHPPLWIGGNSKRALEKVAEFGNGWHGVRLTPEEIKDCRSYLKEISNEKYLTISVRNNIQITNATQSNKKDLLRGNTDKIVEGFNLYRNAGVDHLILYILSGDLNGIYKTMEVLAKDIKRQLSI